MLWNKFKNNNELSNLKERLLNTLVYLFDLLDSFPIVNKLIIIMRFKRKVSLSWMSMGNNGLVYRVILS